MVRDTVILSPEIAIHRTQSTSSSTAIFLLFSFPQFLHLFCMWCALLIFHLWYFPSFQQQRRRVHFKTVTFPVARTSSYFVLDRTSARCGSLCHRVSVFIERNAVNGTLTASLACMQDTYKCIQRWY